MFVVGHVLLWHQQTPAWVFAGEGGKKLDRETALARLQSHVTRSPAATEDGSAAGTSSTRPSRRTGRCGGPPGSRLSARTTSRRPSSSRTRPTPHAELYYNDYNLWKPAKRDAAIRLVAGLQGEGPARRRHRRAGALGPRRPAASRDRRGARGDPRLRDARRSITELDVDVLPRDPDMWGADLAKKSKIRAATNVYPDGLPAAVQKRLARRYADVFALFLKHDVGRVTFWGVTDATTWLHDFPIPGRVNYPLLWDRARSREAGLRRGGPGPPAARPTLIRARSSRTPSASSAYSTVNGTERVASAPAPRSVTVTRSS